MKKLKGLLCQCILPCSLYRNGKMHVVQICKPQDDKTKVLENYSLIQCGG